MGKEGRITAHQIAAMLGVSQPTVSRALRGNKKVNETTRARLVALATELTFSVDHNGLRLSTPQTFSLSMDILFSQGLPNHKQHTFHLILFAFIAA